MKKALIFTSNRSEWGLLKLLAIKMREVYDLKIIACASHLDPNFDTLEDLKDFDCVTIENNISSYTSVGNCKSSGVLMITLPEILGLINPEFVILLGDRYETLCAAYTCNILGIRIVHLHGGEKSGNIDNIFRDCITRMSYVHCTATYNSYNRLVTSIDLINGNRNNIYLTGALGCEELKKVNYTKNKKKILLIYHPNTINKNEDIKEILDGILFFLDKENKKFIYKETKNFGYYVKVVLPNNDFGNSKIIKKIQNWSTRHIYSINCISHLERNKFIEELKSSYVIVGNSSAGIIEAPSLGIPTINFGSRQINREKASSVFNVNYSNSIVEILDRIFNDREVKFNHILYLGTDQNGIPASQSILNVLIEVFGK